MRIQRRESNIERTGIERLFAPPASLTARMAAHHVPGVGVAVIHDGKIEWARGFGFTRIGGAPVTADTLFQAGSISKPVAAMALLHLAQAGTLDLDADVNKYLKTWKVPQNDFTAKKAVTLRELVTHTAGMTVHGFPGYAQGEKVPTLVQVLDGAKPANTPAIRVDTVPGTAWRYSDGGITVMQQALQDVSGKPFPQLMQETVLGPLSMTHSTYAQPLPAALQPQVATPYDGHGKPIEGGAHTYPGRRWPMDHAVRPGALCYRGAESLGRKIQRCSVFRHHAPDA